MTDGEALYARMVALAVAKIKQYGKPIVLTSKGSTDAWQKVLDPTTGRNIWIEKATKARVTVDPTTQESKHKGYGLQDRYKGITANNANIQLGDIRLYAINIPEPKTGDMITMNGKTKTIVTTNPVQPGETVIMWDIQLR